MITVSNEIYNNNLNSLRDRYAYILEKIENKTNNTCFSIDIIDAKDGNKTMLITKENQSLYIHSKYHPLEEAEKWVDNINIHEKSVIIIFGFGLGYHLQKLVKRMAKKNRLFIIEPNIDIFLEALKYIDYSDIIENPNILLSVEQNEGDFRNTLFQNTNWGDIDNITYGELTNYSKLFIDEYKIFLNTVKDLKNSKLIDRNTTLYFSSKWQENLFRNIPFIYTSSYIKDFYGTFKNKPAIIISAGPSLNKNIHLLKELKEFAVLIAVGTSLRALLKAGIKPDIIISLDGNPMNYKHFEGLDYDDFPLVYTTTIYPDILKNHKGEKCLFITETSSLKKHFNELNIDVGTLNLGGSVANSAFDLAVRMEADPIIFVGQDLAYPNNQTHAQGTIYEKNTINDNKEYLTIKDIYGNDVLTDKVLYSFLTWFENAIARDKTNRTYIDATEGGAKIKGTKVMTLKEVKENYCKNNIEVATTINKILAKKNKLSKETMEEIISEYRELDKELGEIRNRCKKGEQLSFDLYSIYQSNRFNNNKSINTKLKRLDEIDKELKKRIERFELMEHILQPILYSVDNMKINKDDSEREKGMKIAQHSKLLYQYLKEAIDYVQSLLDNTITELEYLYK